ncbi:hypothetical protein ACHMW6_06130 [Pseudoduganella sp. UC29_106]|uniref:hypothetical protein n=1 Tax=Pseudoduganella sp. UC29_106 TaxID=3374553 RepID=UPI003756C275
MKSKVETEAERIARLDLEAIRNYRMHRTSMRSPTYRAKMAQDDLEAQKSTTPAPTGDGKA